MHIFDGSKRILHIDHPSILPKNGVVVHILPKSASCILMTKNCSTEIAVLAVAELTIEQTYIIILLYWNNNHIVCTQAWEIQQLKLVFLHIETYVFVSNGWILDGLLMVSFICSPNSL